MPPLIRFVETGRRRARLWRRRSWRNWHDKADSKPSVTFGRAWLALTLALAAHVTDEALTGFLHDYNSIVVAARDRFGWFPMPTFTFGSWLTGLVLLVIALLALTPLASGGAMFTRVLAFPFAIVIGLMNGLGHLGASIYFGRWMPGTTTAPVLIICGTWLLVSNAARPQSANPTQDHTPSLRGHFSVR